MFYINHWIFLGPKVYSKGWSRLKFKRWGFPSPTNHATLWLPVLTAPTEALLSHLTWMSKKQTHLHSEQDTLTAIKYFLPEKLSYVLST